MSEALSEGVGFQTQIYLIPKPVLRIIAGTHMECNSIGILQATKTKSPTYAQLVHSTSSPLVWPSEAMKILLAAKSQKVSDPFCSLSPLSPTSYNLVSQGQGGGKHRIPSVLSFNVCSFVNKNNHLWTGPDANSPQIRNSSSEAQNNTALGKI